ncbi:hypothetical protein S245_066346, partial [Arachis hypogaea]
NRSNTHNGAAISLPSPSHSSFLSTPASCLRHFRPAAEPLSSPSQVGALKITVVSALEAPSILSSRFLPPSSTSVPPSPVLARFH